MDIGFQLPVTNYQFQFSRGIEQEEETVGALEDGDDARLRGASSTDRYDVCVIPVSNYGGALDWFCDITKG